MSVDALRSTLVSLSSSHKLTGADGKIFQYNVSTLDVTADSAVCTLTWKEKIDLGVAQQIHTKTVALEDIASLNSTSSLNSKMNVDPFIQIIQVHMKPSSTAIDTTERFDATGKPMGTPETKRGPVVTIFVASEPEATTVIKQFTSVMTKCAVPR